MSRERIPWRGAASARFPPLLPPARRRPGGPSPPPAAPRLSPRWPRPPRPANAPGRQAHRFAGARRRLQGRSGAGRAGKRLRTSPRPDCRRPLSRPLSSSSPSPLPRSSTAASARSGWTPMRSPRSPWRTLVSEWWWRASDGARATGNRQEGGRAGGGGAIGLPPHKGPAAPGRGPPAGLRGPAPLYPSRQGAGFAVHGGHGVRALGPRPRRSSLF